MTGVGETDHQAGDLTQPQGVYARRDQVQIGTVAQPATRRNKPAITGRALTKS